MGMPFCVHCHLFIVSSTPFLLAAEAAASYEFVSNAASISRNAASSVSCPSAFSGAFNHIVKNCSTS